MADDGGTYTHITAMMFEENKDKYIKCSCCKSKYWHRLFLDIEGLLVRRALESILD